MDEAAERVDCCKEGSHRSASSEEVGSPRLTESAWMVIGRRVTEMEERSGWDMQAQTQGTITSQAAHNASPGREARVRQTSKQIRERMNNDPSSGGMMMRRRNAYWRRLCRADWQQVHDATVLHCSPCSHPPHPDPVQVRTSTPIVPWARHSLVQVAVLVAIDSAYPATVWSIESAATTNPAAIVAATSISHRHRCRPLQHQHQLIQARMLIDHVVTDRRDCSQAKFHSVQMRLQRKYAHQCQTCWHLRYRH